MKITSAAELATVVEGWATLVGLLAVIDGQFHHPETNNCREPASLRGKRLETRVSAQIVELCSAPHLLDRALQAQLAEIDEAAGTAQGLYSDQRRRLRELETKCERTINLCLEGYLSKADMQAMVNKFDKDITARQDDIARLENGAEYRAESDAAVKAARQFCEDLAPTLNRLTTEERQELLRALVDEV